MIALSLILALLGLGAMGLSQARHHEWAFGIRAGTGRAASLRWGGLAIACVSLLPATAAWGAAFGAVGWAGLLSAAAFILLLARSYLPSRAKR